MKNDLINSGVKPILKALSGREEGIFQQIQQDMDAAIDLQEVLNRLLRWAVELVGARDGSLMLIDEMDELCFRARFGRSLPEGKVERTFKPGEGIAGWVVQNGKPYICYDTETDAHFIPIIGGFSIRSLVSVPIISHGVVLGVINVDSPEPNRFSEADAELLVSLANQTAVAIERAELLDSLRQIGEKTLGGAEDLYEYIVDGVRRLTRCPVSMWRVDETGTQARIVASRGISAEYAQEARLDLDRSVTGKAIRERKIIPILDIKADPEFQNKEDAAREGWQSMLAVPLLAGPERAVGTLSIYSMVRREEFTPWELNLLRAYASQAGVAIQNADRLQMIQRLNEVGQSLATLQEAPGVLQETLERIANTAMQVLGADVVDLYQYQADRDDFVLPPIMVGERRFPDLVPKQIFPDDVIVKIAHTGKAIYASDAKEHPVLAGAWELPREERPQKRFVVREEIISSAAVPMKVGDTVVGVMFAGYRQRRDFDTDVELRERIEVLANQGAIAINNARLVQRLRDRADEVRLLQQVSAQISAALELGDILPSLVGGAMRLTGTKSGVVHVIDSAGEKIVGSYAYPEEFRHPAPRISEQGYTRLIIEKGEQRVVPDTHVDTRANPEVVEKGVRSFVGTPLKLAGERVVGVLYLNDTIVRQFTEEELALLRALADQAAIAIEHARLFQELDERATQLERLHKVTTTISAEPPELAKVLDLIVDSLGDIFEGASCAVRLYDSKADSFSPQTATGVFKDLVGYPPRSNGTSRHVISSKTPRYIEDTSITPPDGVPAVRTRFVQQGMRAIALLPLLSEADVTGILYIGLTSPHRFSQNEKRILELFAGQAAIALDSARLFEEREDRIKDLNALFDISQGLSSEEPLTVHDMSQLLYDEASNLMDVRNFYVASYDKDRDLVTFEFAVENGQEVKTGGGEWAPRVGGNGLTEEVIKRSDILYIPSDVGKWREEHGAYDGLRDGMTWDEWMESRDVIVTGRSWLGIPIKVGDEILGVIGVQNYEKAYAYDEHDQRVLSTVAAQLGIAIVRQQLDQRSEELDRRNKELDRINKELDRRIKELEVLTEIGRTVSNLGTDQILDLVYEQTGGIMDLSDSQVQIAFYDEAKDEVSFPLAVEQDSGTIVDIVRWGRREDDYREPGESEVVEQFRPRARRDPPGLTEYVIRTKQPLLIVEDFEQKAAALNIQVWPEFGRLDRPTHSWLGVPMIVQDRVIGIISIQSLELEHAFDQEHVELLTTVASQVAVAIENARLYQTLGRNIEELVALREIEGAIASTARVPDLEKVLELILARSAEVVKAPAGNFMWYNKDTGRLAMLAAVGMPEGWEELSQGIGEGVVGLAAERRETVLVDDVASDPWADMYLPFIPGMRSELAVPVLDGEELLGVLNVEHPKASAFGDEDSRLLEAAATRAVIVIRNAENYRSMREAQEQRAAEEKWGALGRVAAAVGHRVGNKAGVVRLKVKELYDLVPREEEMIIERLQTVERSNQYLLDLADQLLKAVKAASEALEPLDINMIIEDARREADIPSDIEVSMNLAKDLPEVRGSHWFVEVFVELIANAVRAMEQSPEKRLEICSRCAVDNWVEVLVKDTGCGIPIELRDKIFELSFVGVEREEDAFAGERQGFGLWWVKTFLTDIGAQLELLESKLDKGSTFVVRLQPAVG